LTYSHGLAEIKSNNALLTLKDDLLNLSADVKRNQADFGGLSDKISRLITEGGKLATEQAILDSLRFKTMRTRHSKIVEAHKKTFDWMFEETSANGSPRPRFVQWLRQDGGLYWIAGKAGSGKSTLMKYLSDSYQAKRFLEEWAGSKSLFTGSYFFWSGGNEMQKSQQGLLQSLLFDVLKQCPTMIPVVSSSRWSVDARHQGDLTRSWTRAELLEAFDILSKQRFCFFVDGLDEYEGDPVEVVDTLKGFAMSSDIKVCLSSRPWTELEEALSENPDRNMMLQDFTKEDIRRYIDDLLIRDPRFQRTIKEDHHFGDVSSQILEKAEGVFLWVFLVVRLLLKGLTHADTMSDLQRRLQKAPPTLEEYFMRMLEGVENVYHEETAQILQMCLAAESPLNLMTFSFLEQKDPNYALLSEIMPWTEEKLMKRCEVVRKRVKIRCRDLLEISPSSLTHESPRRSDVPNVHRDYQVDFLHRTVRDFFLSEKMQRKLSTWIEGPFNAHLSLCRAFLAYMKIDPLTLGADMQGFTASGEVGLGPITDRVFLDLIDDFLYHARHIEIHNQTTEVALIEEVDRVIRVRYSSLSLSHGTPLPILDGKTELGLELGSYEYKEGWILTMAVQADLKLYVTKRLEDQPALVNGVGGRPLLYCALMLPMKSSFASDLSLDMLRLLLHRKADPNQAYKSRSTWGHFLEHSYKDSRYAPPNIRKLWAEAIKLLLEHGADPDAKFETGRSSEKPTFSGRIIRYPIYNSVGEIIDECCPQDAPYLRDILEQRRRFSLWRWIGWT
jgi:hypothetical protein